MIVFVIRLFVAQLTVSDGEKHRKTDRQIDRKTERQTERENANMCEFEKEMDNGVCIVL